jgi:hypothetical protein
VSNDVFNKLKNFSKSEFGPNADKLSEKLLLAIDEFRDIADTPLIVTSAYRVNDSGYHGEGLALDIVAPKWNQTPYELYTLAKNSRLFNGIGIYSGWNYNGTPVTGLHVDVREGRFATWLGVGNSKRTNQYYAVTETNLKKYKLA